MFASRTFRAMLWAIVFMIFLQFMLIWAVTIYTGLSLIADPGSLGRITGDIARNFERSRNGP